MWFTSLMTLFRAVWRTSCQLWRWRDEIEDAWTWNEGLQIGKEQISCPFMKTFDAILYFNARVYTNFFSKCHGVGSPGSDKPDESECQVVAPAAHRILDLLTQKLPECGTLLIFASPFFSTDVYVCKRRRSCYDQITFPRLLRPRYKSRSRR